MTPERFKHIKEFRLMYGEVSCTATAELIEEIERLHVELAEMKKHLDLALPQAVRSCLIEKELEQAKSQQVHCMACGGVECHRLAEIVKLTGMESDQHLVEWVEQAKDAIQKQAIFYTKKVLEIEGEAKERERQLQKTLAITSKIKEALRKKLGDIWRKYNQLHNRAHWLEGRVKMLEDREQLVHELGTGYAAPKLENRELRAKIKDLESATARLREALTKASLWFGGSGDGGPSLKDVVSAIEAALTVPPAPVRRTEEERERDKAEMRKVSLGGLGLTVPPKEQG